MSMRGTAASAGIQLAQSHKFIVVIVGLEKRRRFV
jgi:hypothetical protein